MSYPRLPLVGAIRFDMVANQETKRPINSGRGPILRKFQPNSVQIVASHRRRELRKISQQLRRYASKTLPRATKTQFRGEP
ncbi:hypothetical protein LB506_008057 [Fusarium annulatum]|nr:hypothetical protein LB506_008057 [Fusarium annulatum]